MFSILPGSFHFSQSPSRSGSRMVSDMVSLILAKRLPGEKMFLLTTNNSTKVIAETTAIVGQTARTIGLLVSRDSAPEMRGIDANSRAKLAVANRRRSIKDHTYSKTSFFRSNFGHS